MQDDYNFKFDDDFEDISSFSNKAKETRYEDIVSDSSYNYAAGKRTPQPQYSGRHTQYRRRKRGFAGFVNETTYKIKRWWVRLKKGQRAAVISVTSVVLIIALALGWFFANFSYNYKNIKTDDLGFDGVIDKKIINIALFGIDTRDEKSFSGLSDSIMILSLNTDTKKVKVISVMRDTLVPIEKDGKTTYNKINLPYSKGGPELAIKTLNQCFKLDISEYATVNFYGMADIIEAVGGIDVTLTDREVTARGNNNHGINDMIEEICEYMKLNPKDYYMTVSGEQHLNGVQAVAYARIRYVPNTWGTNNDYGRTDRQRYVMEQLFNKATKMSKSQYVKLAKALIPCSETSLSYGDIINLAVNILLHSPTFEQSRIPQNDWLMTSPNGNFGSVVYYDLDYAAKVIHGMIYENMSMEEFIEQNPVEKNDWYAKRGTTGTASSSKNNNSRKSSHSSVVKSSDTSTPSSPTVPPDTSGGNDKDNTQISEPVTTEPAKPVESKPVTDNDNNSTGGGSEPSNPTGEPSNPSTPTEPSEPSEPTEPTEPEGPDGPDGPTDDTEVE